MGGEHFTGAAEAGRVYMVEGSWNREFLDEIDGVFGGGAAHDDQADAASGAHEVLAGGEYHVIRRDDYRPVEGGRRYSAPSATAGGRAIRRGGSWTCRHRSAGGRRGSGSRDAYR